MDTTNNTNTVTNNLSRLPKLLSDRKTNELLDMLIGSEIKSIRRFTSREVENIWGENPYKLPETPVVIETSTGIEIYAFSDPEGNAAGTLCFFDTFNCVERIDTKLLD